MDLNLVQAWNTLWNQVTAWAPGLGTFLAVLGLGIVVWFLAKWVWDKRRGGGIAGFPIMTTIIGLILAGPAVVIPVILSIIQVLFTITVNLINWFTQTIV